MKHHRCKTATALTVTGEKRYQLVNDITCDGFCFKRQICLAEQLKDVAAIMLYAHQG